MSRSSTSPISGARITTDTITDGQIPQPHTVWALKYRTADAYACAPNARLNTPEVLYVNTNPSAISA
jgi:hypothetical protein